MSGDYIRDLHRNFKEDFRNKKYMELGNGTIVEYKKDNWLGRHISLIKLKVKWVLKRTLIISMIACHINFLLNNKPGI